MKGGMLLNFRLFSKVIYAFLILMLIICAGTVGFMMVEGWSLLDSFFMTIITISTVGFNEVNELSPNGQLFTSFLIITSFGTFAYAVSAITSYLVGGEYRSYFKEYKTVKEADKLQNHVIICGYGRVGKQAVAQLDAHQDSFIILENDEEIISDFAHKDKLFLSGDATQDEILIKAGIKRAKALITTLPSDSDNLFVVLTAREINPTLKIISRASKSSSVKKLKIAGADNVIMPDSLGGAHMASLVATPDVIEFLDHISIQGNAQVNLESIAFSELPDDLKNKSIAELNAYQLTGCTIIGFKTPAGDYVINPSPETHIIPHSKLFVLGAPEQIQVLNNILGVN